MMKYGGGANHGPREKIDQETREKKKGTNRADDACMRERREKQLVISQPVCPWSVRWRFSGTESRGGRRAMLVMLVMLVRERESIR